MVVALDGQFGTAKRGTPTPPPVSLVGDRYGPSDPGPFMGAAFTSRYSSSVSGQTGLPDANGVCFQTPPATSYAAGIDFLSELDADQDQVDVYIDGAYDQTISCYLGPGELQQQFCHQCAPILSPSITVKNLILKSSRIFVKGTRSFASVVAAWVLMGLTASPLCAADFFVATDGSDANTGTQDRPFATFCRAQQAVRHAEKAGPVTVWVRGGRYYLSETLVFTEADSGTEIAPVTYQAWRNEKVIISGGSKLNLKWAPYRDGIRKAEVPAGWTTDQLFVNGRQQILARYPNFDPEVKILNGYGADAFSPARARRWADPGGGFIHAIQNNLWGSIDYVITGKDAAGNVTWEGGWQINRQAGMHKDYRFVENIFEELDSPGEWFLDPKARMLYYYPPAGLDLKTATVEGVSLRQLVEFNGSEEHPVRHVTFQGFVFRHSARTFMDTKEPLLRSDWTICRSGAVFFNGADDCAIINCDFENLGGNTLFVNNYNRRITIRDCLIQDGGGSGICFVGDPKAVRSPLFEFKNRQGLDQIDKTPGPRNSNYPAGCLVDDCLITRIGRVEKEAAGVEISMSQDITVRHCSIYEVPRAGINIGDGCWGGNVIEFCDVFDTVLETGDHGSFNSWGRDRYWGLTGVGTNELPALALLDTIRPNIIRNSRWRCDHGWDIDLDDGSSNYQITDNLCLNGGIKLREGFYRVCENNIMVNNSFHPHVWYSGSQDVFRHNIVFGEYKPIRVNQPWGRECDYNLLQESGRNLSVRAANLHLQSGADEHSLEADAMFLNPAIGDYRVSGESPALELGFHNFSMDQFGVVSSRLKALVSTPRLPMSNLALFPSEAGGKEINSVWRGAVVKNLKGEEYSAVGVPKDTAGVILAYVPGDSDAAKDGLQTGDFVRAINAEPVRNVSEFVNKIAVVTAARPIRLGLVRDQNEMIVTLKFKALDKMRNN